jgi:hypothetical protein
MSRRGAGVDIDYEVQTSCTAAGGSITCTTDAEMVAVAAALRAAFPAGRNILATATGATSMYVEGAFAAARPTWSSSKGQGLALAKSPAGQPLDLITIMAYLIGETRLMPPDSAIAACCSRWCIKLEGGKQHCCTVVQHMLR